MEKTIKYLENGEYHYATVKDVGDLAKLKTDSKDDLVTAINELFVTGGDAPKKPEGYDKLVDNVADVIQKQEQVATTITNMQQTSQLSDAEMAHMKQVQEELHQEYLKAVEELNKAVEKAKADAAALDKKTNDMQGKIDETFADVNKEVSDVHKQLDAESTGLHKDLDDTKTSLEATRKDLLNSTQEYGQIHSDVKELQDKFNRRVWSTDLDPVREQVSKNSTEVQQTKDELKRKADQSNLDLVTNSVENLSAQVKQNASGLEVAVKRDELGGDVSRLLGDKTNLLLGTRDFSGEDNWKNRDTVTIEPGYYKGLKSAAVQVLDGSIYQPYRVKADTAYTFSFFAREDEDNPKAKLAIKPINAENININNEEQVVHITTEWQRFAVTFSADKECDVSIQVIQGPEASNNVLHLAGFKLQYGQNNTPWEPNEADVAEDIEKNESRFNVFSDKITGLVKKQEQMGDTERQLDTRITETAEGLKQTSKDLQDANGKITEFKGQLESTARGLKTEYEKYTNDAIGQISDSSLNLIRNSAFQNKDDSFAQWQNVSAKANIREDSNGLRWVELTQSGMTTDNPQGITSNYFVIKQGKVTVAVDIKLGDKANIDNQNILLLELYNDNKQRVDFTDVSLEQLGLSMDIVGDHNVHRGLFRLGIDRKDVKYMTVKAILHRNGDLWLTNFSARLSSIDDGGYTPNPDDLSQQILKMNTKIEEDAEHIALKANSVDVTRDIKSAVDGIRVGGRNLANGTDKEYTMGYGIPNTTWQNGYAYESLPTKILAGEILPQNDQFYANLVPGQEYTQTIWFETDADVKKLNAAITWFTSAGHDEQPAKIIKVGENSYKLFSTYTWPGKTGNNVRLFDIFYLQDAFDLSTGTYIKFGKLKLEEGNVSTDWTPSLQDTSEEIKSAKDAAIQVASDQINIHVNEISTSFDDKLNKRVNEVKTASEKFTSDGIEQTVEKITDVKNQVDGVNDRVNNLKVGTSNLLHHSDTFDGWYKGALTNISGKYLNGNIATLGGAGVNGGQITTNLDGPYDDQPVTWTVYAKADFAGDKLHTELWGGGGLTEQSLTTDWKLYKFSGQRNVNHPDFYLWGVTGNKGNIYVALPFAVVGNTIGTWTPNTEDVDSKFQYKEVTGSIDFNDLKTQQKIFYKDVHAQNAPAGSNYWYFLNVDVVPGTARIVQTATSDRDNITWKRTFADTWTAWQKQAMQGDVDALRTETTASVKNLGDRVTTEVNSITSRVDNLKAGGQNLVADGDASAYGATAWENTSLQTHQFYYNNTKLMFVIDTSAKTELTSGCPNWFPVKAGQQYTLYFNGFMSNNVSSYDAWLLGKKADAQGGWTDSYQIIAGERLDPSHNCIVTRTFTVPSSWSNYVAYIRFDNNGSTDGQSAVLFFNEVSVKEGNINTGYSPAPENTVNEIKKLNTKWDVANGQIQGKVTETQVNDILNGKGYATQSWAQTMFQMKKDSITLQAVRDNITNGIQNQVNSTNDRINDTNNRLNNLKIGGTNLLRGTSDTPRRLQGSGYLCETTASDIYTSTADFHDGDQFTYSATITNNSNHPVSLEMWLFNGREKGHTTSNINSHSEIVPAHTQNRRVSATIEITDDTWWVRTYVIYSDGHGVDGETVDVSNEKLEVGTVATDWSPNPNDTGNGVNVLRGTADFSWPTGIGTNGTVNLGYEEFDATTIQLHVWGNNGGIYTRWGGAFPDGQIQVGEQYVFSFDIKGNGTFSSVKNESESLNIASGVPVTNTYQRVKVVGTIKSLDKAFIICFQGDYDVYIKNVKIERGTIATPWTPHPFDDKDKGVNLLKSTAYWNPNDWNHILDGEWSDNGWTDDLGHKAYGRRNKAWNGLGQTVYVTPGVYTWSARIYTDDFSGNDGVGIYYGDSQYNGTVQVQDLRKPGLTVRDKWVNYSCTFYVKNAGNLCVRPELSQSHGEIHVGSQKLEHGMVATPWTPSPNDDKTATITLDSANIDDLKTQGHYFVKNLTGNPIGGGVYVDVTGNNNDRIRQDVYADQSYVHKFRSWNGSRWTDWEEEVKNTDIISKINISPENIRLSSNKIEIDGNTYIHGELNVPNVKLNGNNGSVDLSGDGIHIGGPDGDIKLDSGGIDITKSGQGLSITGDYIQVVTDSNGQKEITGLIGSNFNLKNKNQNGLALLVTPQQELGRPYGGDLLTIGVLEKSGEVTSAVTFDATNITGDGSGFHWTAPHYLHGPAQAIHIENTQDNLTLLPLKMPNSFQEGYYQPALTTTHGVDGNGNWVHGDSGIEFLWDSVKPYGAIDMTDADILMKGANGKLRFGWAQHDKMWNNQQKFPALYRLGNNGGIDSGIAFAWGSTWDLGTGAHNITAVMMNSGA